MNTLLEQHLTELESHNRELLAMNAKLRKENEHLLSLLEAVNKNAYDTYRCSVCHFYSGDCALSCKGREIAALFAH